ncbi:MAG TPA: hypothetical protein DEQ02_02385 [Ruminococcaceae bacterium]|nr:hypothetical protein [Oscillospiraceae bacterium]
MYAIKIKNEEETKMLKRIIATLSAMSVLALCTVPTLAADTFTVDLDAAPSGSTLLDSGAYEDITGSGQEQLHDFIFEIEDGDTRYSRVWFRFVHDAEKNVRYKPWTLSNDTGAVFGTLQGDFIGEIQIYGEDSGGNSTGIYAKKLVIDSVPPIIRLLNGSEAENWDGKPLTLRLNIFDSDKRNGKIVGYPVKSFTDPAGTVHEQDVTSPIAHEYTITEAGTYTFSAIDWAWKKTEITVEIKAPAGQKADPTPSPSPTPGNNGGEDGPPPDDNTYQPEPTPPPASVPEDTEPTLDDPGHTLERDGDGWIELDEDGVPLGRWTWDPARGVWIFDEFPPLGNLPQSGSESASVVPVVSAVGAFFIVMLRRLKKARSFGNSGGRR